MSLTTPHPAVLSESQLAYFRSQIRMRSEALFLAPQLLEHASIVGKQLHAALARIEAVQAIVDELERGCDDANVRAVLQRVRQAAAG